jgi:hypothetical protein
VSILIVVETREVVLASLLFRAICAYSAEDRSPRLEEVFYYQFAL